MNGEKILRIMKEKKITNKQLSARSKVPLGTLNKILYGNTREPSVNTVRNIARALGCALEDFWDSTGNEAPHTVDHRLDSETLRKVREIYEDPDARILLDAKRNLSKKDLASVLHIVQRLNVKEWK